MELIRRWKLKTIYLNMADYLSNNSITTPYSDVMNQILINNSKVLSIYLVFI